MSLARPERNLINPNYFSQQSALQQVFSNLKNQPTNKDAIDEPQAPPGTDTDIFDIRKVLTSVNFQMQSLARLLTRANVSQSTYVPIVNSIIQEVSEIDTIANTRFRVEQQFMSPDDRTAILQLVSHLADTNTELKASIRSPAYAGPSSPLPALTAIVDNLVQFFKSLGAEAKVGQRRQGNRTAFVGPQPLITGVSGSGRISGSTLSGGTILPRMHDRTAPDYTLPKAYLERYVRGMNKRNL